MEQMHLQGRGGVDPNRLVQLEQQLQTSEERRKEEEKKRAIAEGKHRHLENQLKQQVPNGRIFRKQTYSDKIHFEW